MNWSKLLLGMALFSVFMQCVTPHSQEEVAEGGNLQHESKHLIEVPELRKIIHADSIKIIDMRSIEEYRKGHLPNAIQLTRKDIQNEDLPYTGMMASMKHIEALFSTKGIRSSDFIIAYDDKSSCEAARLWWVLGQYGFENVAILHGGIRSWKKNQSLSVDEVVFKNTDFKFEVAQEANKPIGLDELKRVLKVGSAMLLDTRTPEEYQGTYQKKGAFNKGRIPGSLNIDWMHAMNTEDQTFKSKAELDSIYRRFIQDDQQVIVYCHSGVRSSHTLFVLTELLGKKNIKNFDGSWVEWSYFQMPLERDSISIIN